MKDEKVLKEYIREVLLTKEGLGDDVSGVIGGIGKAITGLGGSGKKPKTGVDAWFAKFMQRQLDKGGEAVSKWLSTKLDTVLPEKIKQGISSSSGAKYGDLANVVDGWIDEVESISGKTISDQKKKSLADDAAGVYEKALKKGLDNQAAIKQVKRALDLKYASSLSKKG